MESMKIKVDVQGTPLEVSLLVKPGDPKNPTFLALHGLQSSKELYQGLFEQAFMADFPCMAIDFIGFGESEKSEDFPYEINDQLDMVVGVIERLKIDKFHIIGHSLGGMVGTLLAQDYFRKVLSFSNLEGNLILEDSEKSAQIVGMMYGDFVQDYFPELKKNLKKSKEPSAEMRSQGLGKVAEFAFYETAQSIMEWTGKDDLKNTFNGLRCPKIFVCGDENEAKLKSIEDPSIVRMIPDSGHFMMLDNPKIFYKVIKQFLEEL
ncbi:MAG TPA: alpha/beta hydrolase [Candidatus Gracilibacteria bacterium]